MLETKEKTIGGFDVRCTQHRARAAARLLAKLGRAIGPALTQLGGIDKTADVSALAPALTSLFASMTDENLDALLSDVLAHTSITIDTPKGLANVDLSRPDQIDAAFTGRLPLMLQVVIYALEVNFGGFFAGGQLDALAVAPPEAKP